jgi:hypothetical protein
MKMDQSKVSGQELITGRMTVRKLRDLATALMAQYPTIARSGSCGGSLPDANPTRSLKGRQLSNTALSCASSPANRKGH